MSRIHRSRLDCASPTRALSALAAALGLIASQSALADHVLNGQIGDNLRCTSVSNTKVQTATIRGGSTDTLDVVWRPGEAALDIEGGTVKFSVWGNVDVASSIRLSGIPGGIVVVRDRHGGAGNASRGCGGSGSVDLEITTPAQPATAASGQLVFSFAVGKPFTIPVTLRPHPSGMDLRWPTSRDSSGTGGEHNACLRSNGGFTRVVGDTLEIGLNPDNPMPRDCDVFSLEVFNLRDQRDLRSGLSFLGAAGARNLGITEVRNLRANPMFAFGRREPLNALARLDSANNPPTSGQFAALRLDYAAAASALRAPGLTLAPVANTRLTAGRFQPPGPAAPAPTPATPRTIDFDLALDSFNNISGLHLPMKVRLIEVSDAARSDLAVDFDVRTVCGSTDQVTVTDRSSGSLAITSRQLSAGDGQVFNTGANTASRVVRYPRTGTFTMTLDVTDASGVTRRHTETVGIPRAACGGVAPPPSGVVVGGSGNQPNLLPVKLFPERPLLRRIGGLGDNNIMVPITFCSRLGNNASGRAAVPELSWGVSSAQANAPSVRVELRDAGNGAVLNAFDSGPLTANSAAVTRSNYPGRPSTINVVNVTGGARMVEYGNQAGCFLDHRSPGQRLDPERLQVVVDTRDAVAEGPDARGAEADNSLDF